MLEKWTAGQWAELLDKWFASAPSITVVGKPSAKLSAEIEKVEKERVAKQKEEYGPDGLKKLAEELEKAKEESDLPIPEEVLTSFPVTNVSSELFFVELAANVSLPTLPGSLSRRPSTRPPATTSSATTARSSAALTPMVPSCLTRRTLPTSNQTLFASMFFWTPPSFPSTCFPTCRSSSGRSSTLAFAALTALSSTTRRLSTPSTSGLTGFVRITNPRQLHCWH